MAKLQFLVGDWEGERTLVRDQGGDLRLKQTAWVRPKLMGQILAIEGVGRRLLTAGGVGDTVFNNWEVIDWTPTRGYVLRLSPLHGRHGEFSITVSDSGYVWYVQVPGGSVRYSMTLTPDGEWREKGELTEDGTRWKPTMEMQLKKTPPDKPTP